VRRLLAALALIPALTCSACAPQGLAFRVDKRVHITAPKDEATVRLPLTLRWEVRDFEVVEPGTSVRRGTGYFAVFFDKTPMKPGKTLKSLRDKDVVCEDPCTEDTYFPARGMYTTTNTELVIDKMPLGKEADGKSHRLTIVLLDGEGRRIGETAFHVNVTIPAENS
jgi:hypothetical protein